MYLFTVYKPMTILTAAELSITVTIVFVEETRNTIDDINDYENNG